MARRDANDQIVANCPGCNARSRFVWQADNTPIPHVIHSSVASLHGETGLRVKTGLYVCCGCNMPALATFTVTPKNISNDLVMFFPFEVERLSLPENTPDKICAEFREAENCMAYQQYRAAGAMFRSVLDKVLRINGYKTNREKLQQQINEAAEEGIITESRMKRAHDSRNLGNDILHEEWRPLEREDVAPAHTYIQRIIEDFYDHREIVLQALREKKRKPLDDIPTNPKTGGKDS